MDITTAIFITCISRFPLLEGVAVGVGSGVGVGVDVGVASAVGAIEGLGTSFGEVEAETSLTGYIMADYKVLLQLHKFQHCV